MLEVKEIHTYYGTSHILFGISFNVKKGKPSASWEETGPEKPRPLEASSASPHPKRGASNSRPRRSLGNPPYRIAQMGIGFVPDTRRIFPDLTVRQNILVARREREGGVWNLESIYALFPKLRELRHPYGNPAQRWGATNAHHRPDPDDQSQSSTPGRAR